MAIPDTGVVKHALMRVIAVQPDCQIETGRAVALLQPKFSNLTHDEVTTPFHQSPSHFANRVQTAVARLKDEGWLQRRPVSGTGIWRFTDKSRYHWREAFPDGDELLAEMLSAAL